jgi:tetratricopeptide (TPR) repeat protein
MSAFPSSRLLTTAVAAALLVCTAGDALAQRSMEERRQRREATRGQEEAAKPEAQFPEATRDEPGLTTTRRFSDKLKALSEAHGAGDLAAAQPLADEILGDERANAYERAIALRLLADLNIASDPQKAMQYLRQAVDANGLNNNDHYGSLITLAQLQMQEEDYAAGLATLDTVIAETRTAAPETQVLRGNALYRLERYDEAIAALEPVVRAGEGTRPDWTQLLMAAYADAGRNDEAAALAEQMAAGTPDDPRAQLNLASIYLQNDDYPKAIAVYERLRAAGQLTEERDYRNLMAMYANSEGEEANVIAVAEEGLAKGILKEDHSTWAVIAQAYYFSDQPAKAIEAYQKAAPLDDDGETYLNLAKVLAGEGRDAEARTAAQQALDKGVKRPEEARQIIGR